MALAGLAALALTTLVPRAAVAQDGVSRDRSGSSADRAAEAVASPRADSISLADAAAALAEAASALEAALRARRGAGGPRAARSGAQDETAAVVLASAARSLTAAARRMGAPEDGAEHAREPDGDREAPADAEGSPQSGPKFTTRAAEIELGGRVQVQTATSSCAGSSGDAASPCTGDVPGVDFFTRRVRLAAEIRYDDFLDARIQPDFGEVSGTELKDAWGRLTFSPAFRVKFGHFKRPFDGFQLTSSTRILTIERDLDVPGVPGLAAASLDELTTRFGTSGRDIGIMLDGALADDRFEYRLGVFNGESANANGDEDTKKQFVGRASYSWRLGELPISVAGAAAFTDLPFTATPEEGSGSSAGELRGEYFHNFEAWAEIGDFGGGPHLQAGAIFGENPLQSTLGEAIRDPRTASFADMFTWQLIGSYRASVEAGGLLDAVEPVFRVTQANPNTDLGDDVVWGLTPGLQLFFGGRNKLALNWDVVLFEDPLLESENSFKAQYQFHF